MITNIKVDKINIVKGLLNKKNYILEDITATVESPFPDSTQRDRVLDTSQITLLNHDKKPIKPFTRMRIILTDKNADDEEKEYVYRYVEKDIVTNITKGRSPLYRHTLHLIEISKYLERIIVDNLMFTNYLEENYGTTNPVNYRMIKHNLEGAAAYFTGYSWLEWAHPVYATSKRFIGPYKIRSEDDSENYISTYVGLKIDVSHNPSTLGRLLGVRYTETLKLKAYTVVRPDRTEINLLTNGDSSGDGYYNIPNRTFLLNQLGTYTFKQTYEDDVHTSIYADVSWSITVINDVEQLPQEYTIKEVLDRLLKVCQVRRRGVKEQYFVLDETLPEVFNKKWSPEFRLTQGTLFEMLQQIGDYIHAIPRLVPKILYEEKYDEELEEFKTERNDYSDWNVITFDFLGENEEFELEDDYSNIDLDYELDDYANNFVSNIQNAVQSNYESRSPITEPFIGGFLSTRTESSHFEVSNNECIFKTKKQIKSIIGVKVMANNIQFDITPHIKEKTKYDLLGSYTNSDDPTNNKAYYLYYETGKRNIYGLNYSRPNQTFLDSLGNIETIKRILKTVNSEANIPEYIKDLSVQIEYVPFENFKVKQYKSNLPPDTIENSLFYNQKANVVDIDAMGEQIRGVLLKTGEEHVAYTAYYNCLSEIPRCGMKCGDYYVFAVNREIICYAPIKATIILSKNYNEIKNFDTITRAIRQYEISETESEERNLNYNEFCILDTTLDVSSLLDNQEQNEYITNIRNNVILELSKLAFPTQKLLTGYTKKINNDDSETFNSISYAIVKTFAIDKTGQEISFCFLMPVSCFPFGNSIVIHFSMDDNYSAGTYVTNAASLSSEESVENGQDNGSYALEDYISYGNEFGRFDSMLVAYGCENPINYFSSNITNNSKTLYKVNENNINTSSFVIDMFSQTDYPLEVDKDSREKISLTTQLNFVTTNDKIVIGKAMSGTMPIVGNNDTYKMVIFNQKPNKFDEYVLESDYTYISSPNASFDNNYKYIKVDSINACTEAVGYGIIDSEDRLVIFIDEHLDEGDNTNPIYLMFRGDI